MVDFIVNRDRIALVNVDIQNCFVENSPIAAVDGIDVVKQVNRFTRVCREMAIPVIHTRFVLNDDGTDSGILRETAPPVAEGILNRSEASSALHLALDIKPEDIILEKTRFGAFYNTDLENILRRKEIDTIIITGIATNICCETTAREAMMRDFKVFILSDATSTANMGGMSAAELKRASLTTLGFIFARVLTVDEMIERLVNIPRVENEESFD